MASRHVTLALVMLLALAVVSAGGAMPVKQTDFQRRFISTIRAEAERDSQRDTAAVLAYLDSPGFRSNITACCPTMAELPASELLARLTEELRAAEVVRNFNVQQDWTSEVNMTEWLSSKYDYNLWEMAFLGLHKMALSNYLPGCDEQEVSIMGFPPFKGVPRGSLPKTFAEAAERPIYTAVNLWKVSTGNQEFGPISFVFSPEYTKPMQFIIPMDSGLMRGQCNASNRTTYGHEGVNCDAWPRTQTHRNLGSFDAFNNILAAWLRPDGMLQPTVDQTATYPRAPGYCNDPVTGRPTETCQGSIPTRLFMRLFGETQRNEFSPSNLTLTEGIVPQLYWEAPIAGNVLFPEGVKLVVGQFDALFGTATGRQLQQLAAQNGWVLCWALGFYGQSMWAATSSNDTWAMDTRIVDVQVLSSTSAVHNLTMNHSTGETASRRFDLAWNAAARVHNKTLPSYGGAGDGPGGHVETWSKQWQDFYNYTDRRLRVGLLSARSCTSHNACVGVDADGHCVCYNDRDVSSSSDRTTQKTDDETSARSPYVPLLCAVEPYDLVVEGGAYVDSGVTFVGTSKPRFSWKLRGNAATAEVAAARIDEGLPLRQAAFRIQATAALSGDNLWDSGWVESSRTVGVIWDGDQLAADTRVHWSLGIRDSTGAETTTDAVGAPFHAR